MPRRKSDGGGGREDELAHDATSFGASSGEPSSLPPAGAESAPEPTSESLAPQDAPSAEMPPAETPPAETVDTAAAQVGGLGDAAVATPDDDPTPFDPTPFDPTPPDLTEPAEDASPEMEASLVPPEPEPGFTPHDETPMRPEPEAEAEPEAEPVAEPEPEPVAAVAPTVPVHQDAHDDEEEGGTSVAAWALGLLLVLLAGAVLGTWAAPKIAPALPEGMKPLAEWLEPGMADTDAEIAALKAALESVEAKVGSVPSAGDLDAKIGAAVSPVTDQIAALSQAVSTSDGSEARQQLETLAAELKNQAAQLEALKSDFTGATGEASGDVNVFKADMEGVRAEIASLRDQVSAQAAQLEEVAKAAEARVTAAEQQVTETQEQATTALDAAEANSQAALVRAAVESGAPYADAVGVLEARGVTVPPALAAAAQAGIPTLASLREGFATAAHDAIKASILASAGDGVVARANAFLQAQVASRSLTPQTGTGTDAVLSRMEDKLRRDDLAGALAESQALPSEAAAAMSGWLDSAKLRLGATDGLAALASSLPAPN